MFKRLDVPRHIRDGGTITITWDHGRPGTVIDASRDAIVGEEAPFWQAVAFDAAGNAVGYGRAEYYEDPETARDRMWTKAPDNEEASGVDASCPF
ncbi:hypothetical protein ABZ234_08090 [Nocardiopsis sp. NPDC006198]|uniref:hypothetical protein n=1 Tax=Nocardiopsis sp. NPDC006198 TaxID=3154472 RepID=UPI0033AAAA80